jgi:hypothetical protein
MWIGYLKEVRRRGWRPEMYGFYLMMSIPVDAGDEIQSWHLISMRGVAEV